MDVFLMVRRKKTTIFLDAKETTTVYDLKKMVEGITKVPPENQELYKDDEAMDPQKILGDYGLNCSTAKAQAPAQVGLAYRDSETRGFESLEITPLSNPPELPDVMKTPETQSHEQTMA
ncbi:elongin-B [Trichonephila clavipes]|nr:elongin-B [Trichonephila clavipes]